MLRAYDKVTGKEVGAVYMPAQQSGSPMTYFVNGKQYIVVAISGGPYSGEYTAFALPAVRAKPVLPPGPKTGGQIQKKTAVPADKSGNHEIHETHEIEK